MSDGEWNRDPGRDEDDETPLQSVAAGAVTFLTLGVGFGLMALGNPFFWVAFPVGFGGALPLAVALVRRRREERTNRPTDDADRSDALAELRSRYARGDIDEAEFERRVERLLETETSADAAAYVEGDARERRETRGELGSEKEVGTNRER